MRLHGGGRGGGGISEARGEINTAQTQMIKSESGADILHIRPRPTQGWDYQLILCES